VLARSLLAAMLLMAWTATSRAQTPSDRATAWRSVGSNEAKTSEGPSARTAMVGDRADRSPAPREAVTPSARRSGAEVSSGSGELPNAHGQVWREYDISRYTRRVTATNRPEQAIVDWVLRETGYEAWHSEPLSILSANDRKLHVYHTPEMQAVVAEIVDRFVTGEAETRAFGLRVVTVDHPNWRAKAQALLRPVAVQTPGVQAWVLAKESAAMLFAELQRRSDYREHSSPHLLVNNGQSTVVSTMRNRVYTQAVTPSNNTWPGYQPEMAQVEEGLSLEFNPLLSLDGRMIDATIKCTVNQVEKMVPVMLDVPTPTAPRQRAKIEIPQMTHFRFHERFRWPTEQVLLIDMGMVALPIPADGKSLVPGIPLPLPTSPARANLLVFIESKGKTGQAPRLSSDPQREAKTYSGRY